jgi:hypothetical protein
MKEFWGNYIKAGYLERATLLESLPFVKTDKDGLFIKNMTVSLLQSYIDDLLEVAGK